MEERSVTRIWRLQGQELPAVSRSLTRPRNAARNLTLLMGILLVVLAGCGAPPESVAEQLIEAVNAQDLDGALRLFARDAVVDAGNSVLLASRGEIRHWLEDLFADNLQISESERLELSENRILSRYKVTTESANALGVAYLEGVGEITLQADRITGLCFDLSQESTAELLRATLEVGTPLLSYAVLPDPDPLRASPGEGYKHNLAALWVVVTNNTAEPVRVRSIAFRLPEGDGAGALTPNISGVASEEPEHWPGTGSREPVHWSLEKVQGRYVLEPRSEDGMLEAGDGLSFRLSDIKVGDKPGVSHLEIVEETGDDTRGSMTIQLAKFPWELYVSDLSAWPLVVEPGGSTDLSWLGSDGAEYTLSYGEVVTDVTNRRSLTVRDLTQTTTFYLTAKPVGGGDPPPVIRERTVTVRP